MLYIFNFKVTLMTKQTFYRSISYFNNYKTNKKNQVTWHSPYVRPSGKNWREQQGLVLLRSNLDACVQLIISQLTLQVSELHQNRLLIEANVEQSSGLCEPHAGKQQQDSPAFGCCFMLWVCPKHGLTHRWAAHSSKELPWHTVKKSRISEWENPVNLNFLFGLVAPLRFVRTANEKGEQVPFWGELANQHTSDRCQTIWGLEPHEP